MGTQQIVYAPCKINLHLGIHAQTDERGYHRVDSVMVPVGLCDKVTVSDSDVFEVAHVPALEVAPEKTTVWKAATLLAEELGRPLDLRVDIEVRIPEKAGLGGSSADAGAALRALAERWCVDPLDERVVRVARRVGADVAFFLNPTPSLLLGAGDVLERTFPEVRMAVAVIKPGGVGVSAKDAYAEFDRAPSEPAGYAAMCDALAAGDASAIPRLVYNNLAPAAKALQPGCAAAEAWAASRPQARAALVSGSGSCVFVLCDDLADARAVATDAKAEQDWWSFATLTVGYPEEVC